MDLDIEYARADGHPLCLDLYRPTEAAAAAPGLVFIHGGAWDHGAKSVYGAWAAHYAEKGYVCAAIGYRLARQAPFPAALRDVESAVRWMRANADALGVDRERIALIGQSAGAHLAMLAAYAPDAAEPETGTGDENVSSAVQAVVAFYGPTDLTDRRVRKKRAVRRFLGGRTYRAAPRLYALASPLVHLSGDDPPTLLFHGTVDAVVPVDQSDRLAQSLAELAVPYCYDRQEGWPHAMDRAAAVNARCLFIMDSFLERVLPVAR